MAWLWSQCYPRAPMVRTWIATFTCGWVSAAETTEELMLLLDTHRTHASPGQLSFSHHQGAAERPYQSPPSRRPWA
jgi:hypothetical protein